jgi:predicted membrane protein
MSSIICGLVFLTAGVLLFAFNSGFLQPEYKRVVFSWPMLLFAMGFVFMFSRCKWIAGIILMLIGGFFLLPRLNIEGLEFVAQNGWAIGLIVVGVLVISNSIWNKHLYCQHKGWHDAKQEWHKGCRSHGWKSQCDEAGYIDRNCVFSGGKEKINIQDFKGGEINSVFGGIELDLTDAQLAEGVHRLELNSVFGGVVLYVPIEWKIEIRQTQVFGSFVDNRPKPGFDVNENRTLIIEANSVFGGGEIKCK